MNLDLLYIAIEDELRKQVRRLAEPITQSFHDMLTYHMGWTGEGAGVEAQGKRIRPLLLLLSTAGCGESWLRALPAAAAVELIHNFSLVHDDIQDGSEKRRGRSTVWAVWGIPNAINVGDALFVLANQAVLDLAKSYPAEVVVQTSTIITNACLDLTRGQFMDMNYAGRGDIDLEVYWALIRGKTGALLAACTHGGALLGGAQEDRREAFRSFGEHLGLAFQAQDDILGIWGNENVTGKSVANDLLDRKLSLPVLYGLSKKGKFAELWQKGPIPPAEIGRAAELLAEDGAHEYAKQQAGELTRRALHALEAARPDGEAGQAMFQLANQLLKREQ